MTAPRLHFFECPAYEGLAPAHRMAWWEWGDAGNPNVLVCAHGLTRNGRDFDFLAQALSARYRVLCPDIAGRGKSDYLPNGMQYHIGQYVADVMGWLASLGTLRIDWVGTSMGGMIGMAMASAQPQVIRKMVLNDVGALVTKESIERIRSYVGKIMRFATLEEAEAAIRTIMAPWNIRDEAHWQHMFEHLLVREADGSCRLAYDAKIAAPLDAAEKIEDIDLWPLWEKIQCPVMVIRGAESDLLLRETAEEMARKKPGTKLVEIPGTGHAPSLMDEEQIRLVSEWLYS